MDKNARLGKEINLLKTNLNFDKVELESIDQPYTKIEPLLITINLHSLTATTATEVLSKYLKVDPLLKHTPRVRFITGTAKKRQNPPVLRPLVLCFLNKHYVVSGRKILDFDAYIDLCVEKETTGSDGDVDSSNDEPDGHVVEKIEPKKNKKAEHCSIEMVSDSGIESDEHVPKKKKRRRPRRDKNGNDKDSRQKDRHEPDNKRERRIIEMPSGNVVEPNENENEKAKHCTIEMPPDNVVKLNKKQNDEMNISKKEDNWVYYIMHRMYKTYASAVTTFYKRLFSRD